jgi:hypothetical protein
MLNEPGLVAGRARMASQEGCPDLRHFDVPRRVCVTPDELAGWATEVEQRAGPAATHTELAALFREEASGLPEDDPRHAVAQNEQMVFELFLSDNADFAKEWGPLAPILTSGTGSYPPRVADFPQDAVSHLKLREPLSQVAAARARIQDFLWLRERDHMVARRAIASYIDAFQAVYERGEHPFDALDYLRRGLEIARSLGAVSEDLRDVVTSHVESIVGTESLGYACRLVELAVRELSANVTRAERVLEVLESRAQTAASAGGLQRHDQRSFLDVAAKLARALGDDAAARRLTEDAARSLELEAAERVEQGALIQAALLQQAVETYAQIGLPEDLERAKGLLHDATARSTGEMTKISTSVEIPLEDFESHVDSLVQLGEQIGEGGIFYAVSLRSGLWVDWQEIEAETEVAKRDHPLQYMIPKMHIGPDGQQLPRPSDPDAAKLFDEAELYMRRVKFSLQLVARTIALLEDRGLWTAEGLLDSIVGSPVFADSAEALRCGVEAFASDRHWDAVHVFVPRIERALRTLAQMVGVDVYSYESKTGRVRWRPLDQLLETDALRAVLNQVAPSFALQLDVLLTEPAGLNLRNDVAHGVLVDPSRSYGHSLICILIVLLLGTLRPGTGS